MSPTASQDNATTFRHQLSGTRVQGGCWSNTCACVPVLTLQIMLMNLQFDNLLICPSLFQLLQLIFPDDGPNQKNIAKSDCETAFIASSLRPDTSTWLETESLDDHIMTNPAIRHHVRLYVYTCK